MQLTGADIARDHGLEVDSIYIDSPANRFYLGKNKFKREQVKELVRRRLTDRTRQTCILAESLVFPCVDHPAQCTVSCNCLVIARFCNS